MAGARPHSTLRRPLPPPLPPSPNNPIITPTRALPCTTHPRFPPLPPIHPLHHRTMADTDGLSAEEIARIAESRKKRSFKKFTFRGIDLDKLLDLKPEELLPLFTSRVRRRLQRPLKRKHKALVKKLKTAKKNTGPLEKPAIIKTHLRDLVITPELIGSIVAIYNGKLFNPVEIKPEMVGMYTGEFSMSYRYVPAVVWARLLCRGLWVATDRLP